MATGRYIYTPMAGQHIGRRKTLIDSIRQWIRRRTQEKPDVYMVTGYQAAVMPARKNG